MTNDDAERKKIDEQRKQHLDDPHKDKQSGKSKVPGQTTQSENPGPKDGGESHDNAGV